MKNQKIVRGCKIFMINNYTYSKNYSAPKYITQCSSLPEGNVGELRQTLKA